MMTVEKSSIYRLTLTMTVMLILMSVFEISKEAVFPFLNIWVSRAVTISISVLASGLATVIGYRVYGLNRKIDEDSSKSKQAEQALADERFMLRQLIDNLPDYIYVKDRDCRYIIKNKADYTWMGAASLEEVIGKTDFDYYPQDFAAQFYADDKSIVETGRMIEKLEPSVDHFGNRRWMLTTKAPLHASNGDIIGLVGIGRDMTEHQRTLDEIRELKNFNESIIQTMTEGIVVQDASAMITFVNPAVSTILGYKPADIIGKGYELFFPEDQMDVIQSADQRRMRGEADNYEVELLRKDGHRISVLVSGSPRYENGVFTGTVAVFTDITARKRAEQQVQLQLRRLAALHDIDMAINASMNLKVTLNLMLGQITAQLGVDAADILLFNNGTQTLEFAAGYGFRTNAIKRTLLWLGEDLAGQAALERRQIFVNDLTNSGGRFSRSSLLIDENFHTYFGVPLIAKGQIKGVLEIFHRTKLDSNPEWIGFLESLATQAAIAIENSELFEGMQRSNVELMLAYDATIEGWSQALDLRDRETEGHTQRVTELTLLMASRMGFSETELTHIRRGALLHDIGKMGIPDSILLKPGPLTEDEWLVMRQHPVYAFNLLSPIAFLRSALDIPYSHHEKWDGSGYPRGLKGEEIPLASRIFAIIDVYDALRSPRPYRNAQPEDWVIQYIKEQSGHHFDPLVVETFLQLVERFRLKEGR